MEKKREITEEQVKEYQMLLAQWMQLPKDALEILNEDMPWRIREWLYVCALDQISGAELQAMKPQGLKKIQDIPGAVSQTEVSGFKGNSNSVECTTKADGRRERETGNCFVQTAGGSATDPAVSGTRKQTLKEWEEQWLEERRKYKEQFQQMEINRMEEENRGVFGIGCGRKTVEKHNYIGNRHKWINLSNRC